MAKIKLICLESGEIFESCKEACEKYNIDKSTMRIKALLCEKQTNGLTIVRMDTLETAMMNYASLLIANGTSKYKAYEILTRQYPNIDSYIIENAIDRFINAEEEPPEKIERGQLRKKIKYTDKIYKTKKEFCEAMGFSYDYFITITKRRNEYNGVKFEYV